MGSSELTVLCAGSSDRFEQHCEELALSGEFRTVVVDPNALGAELDDVDAVLVEVTGSPEGDGSGDAGGEATDREAPSVTSVVDAVTGHDTPLPVVALAAHGAGEAAALAAGADRTVRFGEGDVAASGSTLRAAVDPDDGDRPLPGESELLLKEALDALQDVFFVFDLENRMLTWNDRLREVTGHDDADIRELGPLDFLAPEDRPEAAEAIQRVVADGEASEELQLFTADGRRIDYAFRASLLRDSGGEPVAMPGPGGTSRTATAAWRRSSARPRSSGR